MADGAVGESEARAAADRVLGSPEFAAAARLSSLLRHVVDETLAGRGASLKGYAIGVDVFGRPADFDATADPIVRVEASRLRRALAQYYQGSGETDPVVIRLPRGGYVPTFERRGAEPALAEPDEDEAEAPGPAPEVAALPRRTGWRAALVFGAGVALGAAVIVLWSVFTHTPPAPPRTPLIVVEQLSVQSRGDAAFARGLTTEFVAELARFREIAVAELDESSRPPDRGYRLGGSVRRGGTEIRVTVQLVEASTQQTVWSQSYARAFTLDGMLAIQDEIARAVAIAVAQPYGAVYERELVNAAAQPDTLDGYTCVLHAYGYWRSLERTHHAEIRACLERTVTADPDYAAAWQALTYLYLDEYRYGYNPRPVSEGAPLDRAMAAAQRSVTLSPTDARSYQALYSVLFLRGDLAGFRKAGEQALALNPNNPDIIADFGGKLAFSGDWAAGLPKVNEAIALNPGHPGWYYVSLVLDAYRREDYRGAIALTDRMNMPDHARTQAFLAMSYGQLGDEAGAAEARERLTVLDPAFARDPEGELQRWGLERGLIARCLDGLTKAGLPRRGS